MKNSIRFILAWVFALIAFSQAFARKGGESTTSFSFQVSLSKSQESTSYKWGARHVHLGSFEIKNTSGVAVTLNRLWFDWAWTVENLFLEDGDNLVQFTLWSRSDDGRGVAVSITIPPGATHTVNIRGNIRGGSDFKGLSEAWVRYTSLDIDRDGPYSMSFEYPNFPSISHGVVDRQSSMPAISNSSGLAKLENNAAYGFTVSGDRLMKTKVLVRVAGPALASLGVRDPLFDPVLRVMNAKGEVVADSDDWAMALESRFVQVGAFPFRRGSFDAAVEVDLLPGSYTVQIKSIGPATGSYVAETYQLPEITSAATVIVPVAPGQSGKG